MLSSTESKARKRIRRNNVKGYGFLSFARHLSSKYGKQLLDHRIYALKIDSVKVIHIEANASGKIIDNKIFTCG